MATLKLHAILTKRHDIKWTLDCIFFVIKNQRILILKGLLKFTNDRPLQKKDENNLAKAPVVFLTGLPLLKEQTKIQSVK